MKQSSLDPLSYSSFVRSRSEELQHVLLIEIPQITELTFQVFSANKTTLKNATIAGPLSISSRGSLANLRGIRSLRLVHIVASFRNRLWPYVLKPAICARFSKMVPRLFKQPLGSRSQLVETSASLKNSQCDEHPICSATNQPFLTTMCTSLSTRTLLSW
jgi:hypothetical protein